VTFTDPHTGNRRLPIVFSDADRDLFSEAEAESRLMLADGLNHFNPNGSSVAETAKGNWRKVAIAWSISERTTVRQNWIAGHLNLKSASTASRRVRQYCLRSVSRAN